MTTKPGRWPLIGDALTALVDPRLTGAACAGRAPLFDEHIDGELELDRHARLDAARHICHGCPVQSACRVAALEQHHPAGVWAGRLRNHNPQGYAHARKDRSA
ncbi:WhiB family transcriptional regulator [Rhodococcus aetherivorans]|uniref:WhiB family transcriptional regulator n=1 Tax=Rhodococcus aetherivorans TaxID=191292 RepID=UPI0026ED03D0|nr:WhiB family transcriptional regulator [Rhodococcus aetherivorans]WKX00715.1 WhiB family transcriptional regulator [Rhodococcus aetherivorans]